MALSRGTHVGGYEVLSALGRGGMGEVYRAHDAKLRRDVALKVLSDSFAHDRDRIARLQREAEVLASLNHPHIAAIYGLEETGSTKALVLELVEGPTLAERIVRGPFAMEEAWPIARQIADALEAAHSQGIIHRDLKPSNIKVKDDGTVKVLDFGLAKALDPLASHADVTESPTVTTPAMTQAGVLLGTAAYMSPEQAKRRPVDQRGDIWAFGCVLYEMLAGKPAFDGDGMEEVLGAVMRLEPDWHALSPAVSPGVQAVLKRCLQKSPALRIRDIADARFQIEDALAAAAAAPPFAVSRGRSGYAGWAVAALSTVAAVVAIALLAAGRVPGEQPEARLQIVTPPGGDPLSFAISPDGLNVVYQAGEPTPQLWLRPLASEVARPLAGTERATMPFWSPDAGSIGFFADGQLKRIDLASGFVRSLASATLPRRGAWNRAGTIIFGAASVGPLSSVSADGGAVKPVTALLPGQTNHRWPQFLPDGRRFLLFALGAANVRGLYQGSLDGTTVHRVSDRESAYWFMPPSHALFARQGALWARRLDGTTPAPEGDFMPVAPKVLVKSEHTGYGAFSSSATGSIAYRGSEGEHQLVWVDRSGRTTSVVGPADDTIAYVADLSSDGRAAAVARNVQGNLDVWLVDTERGGFRRLTIDPAVDGVPVLSPDGRRVIYATDGKADVYEMYERRTDRTDDATLVLETGENKNPTDWSPDGRYILYTNLTSTDNDVLALPLFGDRKPIVVARTSKAEWGGKFSPDSNWVAYSSMETERLEVYIQPFPGPGPKVQVSVGGGWNARWRRDGRELFYLAPDDRVMAVSITTLGPKLEVGSPRPLFTLTATGSRSNYEPSPDGQRFLVLTRVSEPSPITVILNWKAP